MGEYSDALALYRNAKWAELAVALCLWCLALGLYLWLKHRRFVRARPQQGHRGKDAEKAARRRLVPELPRRCAFYVLLFVLILVSCLWSYLSDLIPAERDRREGTYETYTGEITYEERLGGILTFAAFTDRSGNVQRVAIPAVLRSRLTENGAETGTFTGRIVWGSRSRVLVGAERMDGEMMTVE